MKTRLISAVGGLVLLGAFATTPVQARAQRDQPEPKVSLNLENASAEEVVQALTRLGVNFVFDQTALPSDRRISLNLTNIPRSAAVEAIAEALGYTAWQRDGIWRLRPGDPMMSPDFFARPDGSPMSEQLFEWREWVRDFDWGAHEVEFKTMPELLDWIERSRGEFFAPFGMSDAPQMGTRRVDPETQKSVVLSMGDIPPRQLFERLMQTDLGRDQTRLDELPMRELIERAIQTSLTELAILEELGRMIERRNGREPNEPKAVLNAPPDGIRMISPDPVTNSLIVQGTEAEIQALMRRGDGPTLSLLIVPPRPEVFVDRQDGALIASWNQVLLAIRKALRDALRTDSLSPLERSEIQMAIGALPAISRALHVAPPTP